MFQCYLRCYPWDLLDEGVDTVLDRLQGEVGATGLTLVVVSDELQQFRPHLASEPKIFRTAGGVYYRPNMEHYQASRLKPLTWSQHAKVDVLAKASEACAERQLDLRLAVTPFMARRTATKHPEAACKNAYGIVSTHALCPANPDVQEYLAAMVHDLSAYDDVSGIVLEEVEWPVATDIEPFLGAHAMLDTEVADLLGICFSESSLQAAAKAGVDGQAALRAARAIVDQSCALPLDAEQEDILNCYPAIARYLEWSEAALIELYQRLEQSTGKALILSYETAMESLLNTSAVIEFLEIADRSLIDAEDLEQVIEALNRGQDFSGLLTPAAVGKMELLVCLDGGMIDDAPELVRQVSRAAEAGAGGVTVSHYGAIMETQFEWVHQALRNARRLSNL